MKILSFFLIIFFINHNLYSQDTIKFLNKSPQVVKVYEVGIEDVKYHRFDNLDGPSYVASKADIQFIKYANGHVDSFNVASQKPLVSNDIVNTPKTYSSNEKIIIVGNTLTHFGKPIGEARLFRLINNSSDQQKKQMLMKEYFAMKSYKKKQYLFGFVGLGAGLVLAYVGGVFSLGLEDATPVIIGVSGGVALGTVGAVISKSYKNKRIKKKVEIANLYNN